MRWTQKFGFDVENLSLVVPQQSEHERHPVLDVALHVPLCADGASPDVMCFEEITDHAEGVQMLAGKAVRVARGGRTRAGGELTVETSGWPSDPHVARWASALALAAAAGLGLVMIARARRRGTRPVDVTARLTTAREKLLDRIEALELAYLAGQVLEQEYEAEQELIVGELALIERRLRELAPVPANG